MKMDVSTKITQILEITNTDLDGNEVKQYMKEEDGEWIIINKEEYNNIRGK